MLHPKTFDEFSTYYLQEHSRPETRALHIAGTTVSLMCIAGALTELTRGRRDGVPPAVWFGAAAIAGYLPAWWAHFAIERNRPATFTHPLWSLRADLKMWRLWAFGGLDQELERVSPH